MLGMKLKLLLLSLIKLVDSLDFNDFVATNVRFYFYHGTSSTVYDPKSFASIVNNVHFDEHKPTTFYVYGTLEGVWIPTVIAVKNAYIANDKHNFIIVGNQNPFLHVFKNAPIIAEVFAQSLLELLETGYEISNINLVAFSLGAKAIAPLVSRIVKKESNGKYLVPRIVALDPGVVKKNEMYLVCHKKLSEDDAAFVMTIHTDCRNWGTKEKLGHVNFWINGGCDQPTCVNELTKSVCNHFMAPLYWSEAVMTDSRTAFKSRQCANYKQYLKKDCDLSLPVAYIGLYTPKNLTGDFYVKTKKVSPYSRS